MPYSIKPYAIGFRAGLLLLCLVCAGPSSALASIPSPGGMQPLGIPAAWQTDLDETIGHARISLRPILVFFTGPNCLECAQIKRFSLGHQALQPLIREFERVEIDLAKRPELARVFQIAKIPALYVIAPEGRIKGHQAGYATAKALEAFLRQMLAGELSQKEIDRLRTALATGQGSAEQWRKALAAMEDDAVRDRLHALADGLSPADLKILTACLTDPLLAVRLGALDLLESANDTIVGFDPWIDPVSPGQQELLARWRAWASSDARPLDQAAALTQEKFDRSLQDLIGDDPQRSRRAMQVLARGGQRAALLIADYLKTDPKLDANALRRIKEVQYTLCIPSANGLDPQATAHGIVWGNQDVQLRAVRQLADCGTGPAAILVDLLAHEDPLVRETAVEVLFKATGALAVAPVKALLERENDPDISFTALKHLGDINTTDSRKILESYFAHANEDLVIAAIQGAVQSSVGALGDKLLPLLEDPRWRVRVAAIEGIKEKGGNESGLYDRIQGKEQVIPERISRALLKCLDDPDEFVRHTAAVTLGELKVDGAQTPLRAAYAKHPQMHGVIVSVLLALDASLPSAYIEELFGPDPDDLLFVLDRMEAVSGAARELIHRAGQSENPDIACSALRIVAKSEQRNAADNALLLAAIRSGVTEKQLTVIQEFDVDSEVVNSVRETMKKNIPPDKALPFLSGSTTTDVLFAVADLMKDPSASDLVRGDAMVLLCRYGHREAFEKATAAWPDLTSSMRRDVARSLPYYGQDAIALFNLALEDDSTDVWQAALDHLSDNDGRTWFAEPVRHYLSNPASRLTPAMIWPAGLNALCAHNPEALVPFTKTVLAEAHTFQPDRVILALTILAHAQIKEADKGPVLDLTKDPNPLIRRAAWIALASRGEEALTANLDAILADPSKYVREIIPSLLYNNMYDKTELVLYFSDETYFTGYEGLRIDRRPNDDEHAYGQQKTLRPETIDQINAMIKDDPSPLVRFRCMLCLLSYQIPLDLNAVYETGKLSGEPRIVADLVADFFSTHSHRLGENFSILIPLVQTPDGKSRRAYAVESFLQRRGGKVPPANEAQLALTALADQATPTPAMATFTNAEQPNWQDNSPKELVLFTTAVCRECFAAEKIIQVFQQLYSGLRVTRHDLLTREGLAHNEVLSRRFGIDEAYQATAPTLFMASGSLAGPEISFFSFEELVRRSDEGSIPLSVSTEELKAAEGFIEARRKAYAWHTIAKSGFIQGLSPCLLAALLLLLRYLSRAGQTGPAILRHGARYLAVVAAATFCLWLIPQMEITKGTHLHDVSGALLWLILFCMVVIALRLFLGSLWRLRKKAKEKQKTAKVRKMPGRRYILGVVLLWAAAVSTLDITGMGNAHTITLAYSIKNHIMPIASGLILITFCVACMLPSAGILWFFSRFAEHPKVASFIAGHRLMLNMALSAIWFWLAFKHIQLL